MTPLEFATQLAGSRHYKDRVLGVAMIARGLSDDDGLRQGWPVLVAIDAAMSRLNIPPDPAFEEAVLRQMPKISDALMNKGAATR